MEHVTQGSTKKIEKMLDSGVDPNFITDDGSEFNVHVHDYLHVSVCLYFKWRVESAIFQEKKVALNRLFF